VNKAGTAESSSLEHAHRNGNIQHWTSQTITASIQGTVSFHPDSAGGSRRDKVQRVIFPGLASVLGVLFNALIMLVR